MYGKNHLLVFGVNYWHKVLLAVCTRDSQNPTDKEVCTSSFFSFLGEWQESSEAESN